MPMPLQMLASAKAFIATLDSNDVAAFEGAIALKALEGLSNAGGIEFWTADFPQRNQIAAVIKAGAAQAQCVASLKDRCAMVTIGAPLPKPFVTDEFDRSGWFDYFYSEAADFAGKDSTGMMDRLVMEHVSNVLFFKRVQSVPKNTIALALPYDQIPDAVFKHMLRLLLEIGFYKMPATQQQAIVGDVSDATLMSKMLWAGRAEDVTGTAIRVIDVAFKWRGDSRPYDVIKTANGFSTKANSETYARIKNVSAPWNPFADEGVRSFLWYRKTATDNCLYNTISVGKTSDWKTYLAYPLIKLSGGKVTGLQGYQGRRKVKVAEQGLGPGQYATRIIELPCSVTYLYLFVFAGLALDTGAMQGMDAYPEIGVGSIPFKNVYGSIRCVRYHLGDEGTVTDNDGIIVRLERGPRSDDNNKSIDASYGQALFAQMTSAYIAVLNTPPVGVRWQASGAGYSSFNPMNEDFTVDGVKYRLFSVPS